MASTGKRLTSRTAKARGASAGPPSGREAAQRATFAALSGTSFASDTLSRLRKAGGMDGREVALAAEIALGSVRHLLTIEHVLSAVATFDPGRVPAGIRSILYNAAYQIIFMDRVPMFAAVDESVMLAGRLFSEKAGGMVNAVLRRLSGAVQNRREVWRRGDANQIRVGWEEACGFSRAVLPTSGESPDVDHLAAATGERRSRLAELVDRHGIESAESTAWASQATPAIVVHRNPLRIAAEAFRARVRDELGPSAECDDDAAYLSGSTHVVESALFRDGMAHIQDGTAYRMAKLLNARPGERVLDLCAAPGGKSVVIAEGMQDSGEVVASDASTARLRMVQENAARMQLRSIRAVPADEIEQHSPFDAAIVDAPCSNTGVIARRPEARLGLTAAKTRSLVALQAKLVTSAAALVRPGGRLIYGTCSIEPEENGGLVAGFLRSNSEWELESSVTILPQWGPRASCWRDGGFGAVLVRRR